MEAAFLVENKTTESGNSEPRLEINVYYDMWTSIWVERLVG